MDEHGDDAQSADAGQPDAEPRSYDPTDEASRPPQPQWDSWADPASSFPPVGPQPDQTQPDQTQPDQTQPDQVEDEFDPDATQQWAAFSDELPEDSDQADPDQADSDQADPDQADPDEADPDQADPDQADSDVAGESTADSSELVDPHESPTELVDLDRLPIPDPISIDPEPAAPEVEEGQLIADRFRLEEQLAVRAGFLTWRAFDVKLSRPVLVHLLHKNDPRSESVLVAARDAATATDSAFLRVLDAATATDDIAYVVCEYVSGKSLEQLLAEGPLSGLEAAWVLREVARAMSPMHAKGLFHLRLNPDTVIISSTGNVRLVGFLIDAALTPRDDDQAANHDLQEADVHALGQLLYAMLVSRWPVMPDENLDQHQRHYGLAPAPMDHEGWLTPRQVRAGVSPALDQLTDNVLHAQPRLGGVPLETAAAIDEALERVLGTADASSDLSQRVRQSVVPVERTGPVPRPAVEATARPASDPRPAPIGATPESPRRRPPQQRIWLRLLMALIAIVLISSLIAVAVKQTQSSQSAPSPTQAATPVVLPISKVDDFDPEADGGNNEENPNTVANAWDKKPDTAWTTLTYLNNPKLGGLKPGVGLVVDLGQPVEVGTVNLTMVGSPTAVSIYVPVDSATAADPSMTSVKDWTQVATNAAAGVDASFALEQKVTTRYVLVYLTSLPQVSSGKYRGGVAEIEVKS